MIFYAIWQSKIDFAHFVMHYDLSFALWCLISFVPKAFNFICDKGDFVEEYKSEQIFCSRESCLSINVNKMMQWT